MKKTLTLIALALTATAASAQWNTGYEPILVSGQLSEVCSPHFARTADGRSYIAFAQGTDSCYRYHLQMVNADGTLAFGDSGLLLGEHKTPTWFSDWGVTADADGNAIVTYADARAYDDSTGVTWANGNAFQPVAYKVSPEGKKLWGDDGIELRDAVGDMLTIAYNIGGDIWNVTSCDTTTAHRLNADGTVALAKQMPYFQMLQSSGTDFIAVYTDGNASKAMRYNRDFEPQWQEPVQLSSYAGNEYDSFCYHLASDGQGGAYVTFMRNMGNWSHMITSQHVSADGDLLFGLESVDAYGTEEYDHSYETMAANGDYAYVVWAYQDSDGYRLQAQRFSPDGTRTLTDTGKTVAQKVTDDGWAYHTIGAGTLAGGDWVVCYADEQSWSNAICYVSRFDKDGNALWTRQIATEGSFDDEQFIVEDDACYLCYQREEYDADWNKTYGIYLCRILNDGSYGPLDGIQAANAQPATAKQACYTIDGRRLNAPQHGLTIVRQADGTTRKLLVK